jgi:hypothetical protein
MIGRVQMRRFGLTLAVLAIALTSLFSVAAVPVNAQTPINCAQTYTVQPGDNLFRIGLRFNLLWTVLAAYNNLPNPQRVVVGQVLCIPTAGTPTNPPPTVPPQNPPPTQPPATGIVLPPAGVFPRIDFNTRTARPGQTITITGTQFPTNETVDIFIAPLGQAYPTTPSGSAQTSNTGTLNTNFTIPTAVDGVPLNAYAYSVLVRGRQTRYFGFNFFYQGQ